MRHSHVLALGLGSIVALVAACQDDETSSTSSSGNSPTASSSSTSGTGASGGATSTTSTGGMGTGGNGTGGNGTGGMVNLPACTDMNQLLISEVRTGPVENEFVEIWNPTNSTVELTSYHLADNKNYYEVASGMNYMPLTGNPGSDFLIRFPAGTMIGANEVITIEFGTDWTGGTTGNAGCPDFSVRAGSMCNNTPVPQMTVPSYGMVGTGGNQLSGGGEMLMLFCWDGGNRVYDVDYLMYDPDPDANDQYYTANRVDKSNVSGYTADTPLLTQLGVVAPQPTPGESLGRCDATENGETMTGGNGLLGHDETSEDFGASFEIQQMMSPGTVNNCP